MMRMVVLQQPGTDQIDAQPHDSHGDRLVEVDMDGLGEPYQAFPADQQGNQGQNDRAGKASQIAELARTEGKARIARMPARKAISQHRDQHCAGMGGHMPAVGHQRHRAIEGAGNDFHQHHAGRERDHQPHLAFIALVVAAEKEVIVAGGRRVVGRHQGVPGIWRKRPERARVYFM